MRPPGRKRWLFLGVLLGAAGVAAGPYAWQWLHPAAGNRVARVVDGDTLVLDGGDRVRLKGISAPELNEAGGPEARDGLRRLAAGQVVETVTDSHDRSSGHRDRYGRLLAYVVRRRDGLDVNAALLREGLVKVMPGYPADRRMKYAEIEHQARVARRGIWGGRDSESPSWWTRWERTALAVAGALAGLALLLVFLRVRRAWHDTVGGGRPWPR